MKKKRIIIIVLAAIAFFIIGGIFVLNAFIGTDKFKDMLTGMMEKQLQAKVNIDQWEASIFSGMQFTNLSVDQPAGFGTGKLLKTDRFTIKFDFWNLLKKKITFSTIIIDDLSVNLNQNSDGLWFFQTTSSEDNADAKVQEDAGEQDKTDKTASPIKNLIILAETIRIRNANFLAKDKNGNIVGELKDANIGGKVNIEGSRNDVILDINSSAIALSNEITGLSDNISIKNLKVNVEVDKNNVKLQNLSLDIFDGNIQTEMVAQNYQSDQPEVDVKIQVNNLSPAPVLAIVEQPEDMLLTPVTCSMSSKLKIVSVESFNEVIEALMKNPTFAKVDKDVLPALCGLLDNIDNLETNLTLDKVHVKKVGDVQNLIINKANLPVRINKRKIILDKFDIDIWDGKFITSLIATIDTDSIKLYLDIKAEEVNSTPLLIAAGLENDMLDGPLNSHIILEGSIKNPLPFTPEAIKNTVIDGSVSIGKIYTKPAGLIDDCTVSYKIANGNVIISPLSVEAYNGEINVVLKADNLLSEEPFFDTDITINNLDGATLLKSTGQDPDLLSGNLNVKLSAKGTGGKALDSLNVDCNMDIGPLTVKNNSNIDRITIPLKLEDGRLNMQPVIKAFQGEFKATLDVDNIANFQSETTESLPAFAIECYISDMDSSLLLQAAEVDPQILSGPLTMDLGLTGKGNSLTNLSTEVSINIPSVNVEIGETIVDNVIGEFQFANQVAIIKNFSAEVFDGSVSVQGVYDLSNESYDANVNLESLDVAKATEGVLKDIRHIKYLLDTTKAITGNAVGIAKVSGYLDNANAAKGIYNFSIKDGVVAGHPVQKRLSKVLDSPELENIEFSQIDTAGSLDGLLVNLDYLKLKSESVALNATDGIIDMENEMLIMPIEIGLSPKIAAKLNKPVKEIRYGLTKKEDGLEYLPVFKITGSISNPNVKRALVEVVLKSAATGFLRSKILKTVEQEEEEDVDDTESEVNEEKNEDEDEDEIENILGNVLEGILGKEEDKDDEDTGDEDKGEKKSTEDLIRGIFGF